MAFTFQDIGKAVKGKVKEFQNEQQRQAEARKYNVKVQAEARARAETFRRVAYAQEIQKQAQMRAGIQAKKQAEQFYAPRKSGFESAMSGIAGFIPAPSPKAQAQASAGFKTAMGFDSAFGYGKRLKPKLIKKRHKHRHGYATTPRTSGVTFSVNGTQISMGSPKQTLKRHIKRHRKKGLKSSIKKGVPNLHDLIWKT